MGQQKPTYQADWTFYFSYVDDKLGSITTDLNLKNVAPKKGQEHIAYISIFMKKPKKK